MRKFMTLFLLLALILTACGTKDSTIPEENRIDLSGSGPYLITSEDDGSFPYAFRTNSAVISVTNHSSQEIIVYLYDTEKPDAYLQKHTVPSGGSAKFQGLTAKREYSLSVSGVLPASIGISD